MMHGQKNINLMCSFCLSICLSACDMTSLPELFYGFMCYADSAFSVETVGQSQFSDIFTCVFSFNYI